MNFSIYSIACIKRDFLTLSTINSNSFDINSKDQIGNSLLHLSIYNKHLDVISFLLQKGADINIVNAKNETILHACSYIDNLVIADYLLHVGIDLSIRNNHNQTALDLAKKYASVPLVEHLEKFSNFISLNYDLALKPINHLKICNKIKI